MSQQNHTKRDHEDNHKQQATTLPPSNTPRRIPLTLFLLSGCISVTLYYFGDVGHSLASGTATVVVALQQALVTLILGLWGSAAIVSPPFGFPASGNGLWYSEPAVNWSMQYLPIGNGYLGAMINGDPISDRVQLNIESLWTGGPFADPNYNGGNHQPSEQSYLASELDRIRNTIFTSSNGTIPGVEPLPVYPGAYGSYSGAGYLNINRTASGNFTNYARWLDMDHAVLKTIWTEPSGSFNRTYFCSNPTRACTVHTISSAPGGFTANFSFSSLLGLPTPNITCLDTSTIQLRGYVGSPGMLYEILGTMQQAGPSNSTGRCTLDANSGDAVLVVNGSTEAWVSWVGGTEYSMEAGNAASGYTFKGVDPHNGLTALLMKATAQNMVTALATHIADYRSALGEFSLNIGQKFDSSKNTAELRKEYKTDIGNPYLEWLLFNYGRYMLVGSTRSYLPANLQGVWARDNSTPWSGDYHANINTQMNYWSAELTNMKVTSSLWEYMAKTWAPRGTETAKVLYNTTRGWVTHNEMNIFGHTGMKTFEGWNTATWANYPESAAWMMVHVYDHFDYTNDVAWWRAQGWPLLKGVAGLWLDHLIEDRYFNDSTLVTAPCNSPEQPIVTFGCSHSQQLIWQLFEAVEKGFSASGDNDTRFLREVQAKKSKLDKGIRVGSWGQLQEWKLDFDRATDTHRHLSHLIGLYPGYTLTNFKAHTGRNQDANLTKKQVLKASEISLRARGNGTGPDADAGWEKVWRAACWAQLQNSSEFYHILTYAIERNFAENLLSLYYPFINDPIFQIDANLGYPAAVLNALVQAPDTSSLSDPLDITLLPALPHAWASGSILGARIRGGMTLDLAWSNGRAVWVSLRIDPVVRYARQIQLWYDGRPVTTFFAASGLTRQYITIFDFTNLSHINFTLPGISFTSSGWGMDYLPHLARLLTSCPNLVSLQLENATFDPLSATNIVASLGNEIVFPRLRVFRITEGGDNYGPDADAADWDGFFVPPGRYSHPLRLFFSRHRNIEDLALGWLTDSVYEGDIDPEEMARLFPSLKHLSGHAFLCNAITKSSIAQNLETLAVGYSALVGEKDWLAVMANGLREMPKLRRLELGSGEYEGTIDPLELDSLLRTAPALEVLDCQFQVNDFAAMLLAISHAPRLRHLIVDGETWVASGLYRQQVEESSYEEWETVVYKVAMHCHRLERFQSYEGHAWKTDWKIERDQNGQLMNVTAMG